MMVTSITKTIKLAILTIIVVVKIPEGIVKILMVVGLFKTTTSS